MMHRSSRVTRWWSMAASGAGTGNTGGITLTTNFEGSVATSKTVTEEVSRGTSLARFSGSQEQLVDAVILFTNISAADPPRVPPSGSCGSPRILQSFAEQRGTRESSAWPSLAV